MIRRNYENSRTRSKIQQNIMKKMKKDSVEWYSDKPWEFLCAQVIVEIKIKQLNLILIIQQYSAVQNITGQNSTK